MAKLNKEDFISALKEMSILEIKELVDAMKEEFGVDPSAVAVAAGPAVAVAEEGPSKVNVVLTAAGPNKIAPRITGICTVVALMIGSCIIPSGVFARTITIAAISATLTIQLVSCFFVFIFNFPPCYHSR